MKSLPLTNPTHKRLQAGFGNWLHLMGYAASTCYGMPNYLQEFLHWLEAHEKPLAEVKAEDVATYVERLQRRKKERGRAGALKVTALVKHVQMLRCFRRYLRETAQGELALPDHLGAGFRKQVRIEPEVLTQEEVIQLYRVCESTALGQRDRAMLGVFYGCGLRRSEGVKLDKGDILEGRSMLLVRHGKGYKERMVPLPPTVLKDLQGYLESGRLALARKLKEPSNPAFFLSMKGNRMTGQMLALRLKRLLELAAIKKQVSLHGLRHSIATHLLAAGMELHQIGKFLGHQSLESTQIYTRINKL
ncbi:MAG: tyrosine-type recombinase/integrase [Bacteroidota bacterium]